MKRLIRLVIPVMFLVTIMSVMIGFRHLETLEANEMRVIEEFRERWMRETDGPGLMRMQETLWGNWVVSTNANGYFGPDYHAHQPGDGSAVFTWSFQVKQEGTYNIRVNYAAAFDRAFNAPYTVRYSGGQVTEFVDQRTGGGRWIPIGTFDFQQGEKVTVTLSNHADGVVIADAIRISEEGNASNRLILDNRNPNQGFEPVQQSPQQQPAHGQPGQEQPGGEQPGAAQPGSQTEVLQQP
ncbi:golvesin C-terminal-like domain-containing protein [Desmospora profundinema]|uniref:Golvesin/Xly CBD-like domain-containing protein n=1 Tax=Desmospora profundinema TaxID=1571184 RepID=A0ABU1INN9_9BACL|nr:hypothetical protein [Desmospora profundinema]MDR6226396.1 hypothetical protein [Desmospora profundinema]